MEPFSFASPPALGVSLRWTGCGEGPARAVACDHHRSTLAPLRSPCSTWSLAYALPSQEGPFPAAYRLAGRPGASSQPTESCLRPPRPSRRRGHVPAPGQRAGWGRAGWRRAAWGPAAPRAPEAWQRSDLLSDGPASSPRATQDSVLFSAGSAGTYVSGLLGSVQFPLMMDLQSLMMGTSGTAKVKQPRGHTLGLGVGPRPLGWASSHVAAGWLRRDPQTALGLLAQPGAPPPPSDAPALQG